MRRNFIRLSAGGLFLLWCAQGQAQNLVVNTGFATDLSSWTDFGSALPADGTRVWNADDVNAIASSGSAQFTVQTAASQIGLVQCLPAIGEQTYEYYARVKFLAGQTDAAARAVMEIAFFASADCTADSSGGQGLGAVVGTAYPLSDTIWRGIPTNAGPAIEGSALAPAATSSAQVRIFVEQLTGSEPHSVRFDQVVFHNASGVPVTLMHFDVE
ncbi:hypothetical protein DFR29_11038 [Tahibacter aquaticus]|uniref:Carbohydrate binding protein n=1 Tax=Tahibacter aquaticus TaxID=520092 RepID=A0A4R6YTA1_9GAMM|nr:hypothetical protein [Tahibacter aquaticus]TDR41556.1 hypothetical protein DFR29_11038 [Tahibacter aquaticus]